MKSLFLTIFLAVTFLAANAQSDKIRPDSSRKMYAPKKYATDSAKRGNEIYEGGGGHKNKSQGDTLRKSKSGSSKSNKSKQQSAIKTHRRMSLAMNDFKG